MTWRIVYGVGVWVAAAATALTIASIIEPRWLSMYTPPGEHRPARSISYGLHSRCSSVTGLCEAFPQYEDCQGEDRYFCSLWRSVGFLMSFAVILEFAVFIAYAVIIMGGKQKRDYGWKVVCSIVGAAALVQCAAMAIVTFLYNNDERFDDLWNLDTSWILCTVSWSALILSALGIMGAVVYLPEEGGYELIPNGYQYD